MYISFISVQREIKENCWWSGDISSMHVYICVCLCIYLCKYLCTHLYVSVHIFVQNLCLYHQQKRKYEILAENCWWSGDILSVRLRRANQYYICTWYIHWIITTNIVTLAQRQEGKKGGVSFMAPKFRAWNFDHKMLATGRLTKKSFDVTPEILATQFWQQKKTPAAVAVAPQMSNVFWYPRSFVPNKFALDPFFTPYYKISKRSASLWWSAIFTAYLTFHSLDKNTLDGLENIVWNIVAKWCFWM